MIIVMVAGDNIELLQFIQWFLLCHSFWFCFPCLKFVGTRSRSKKILVLPWMRAHINVNHILLEHLDPRSMDTFGDHAFHWAKDICTKFRYDLVRDVIADICYKAGVPARKEVSLGFSTDDDKDLKPADILVLNWENRQDVCMDVTGVSPFTGEGIHSFVLGKAISSAVSRKHTKYLDKCVSHDHGLGVLAFSTLGELGEYTLCFFKRMKNCLVSNDTSSSFGSFIFHRLGIAIQKSIGTQLFARLLTKNFV
ncbi:uncharacterized protein LOC113313982 isoform X2 [Papaver somniferum]|uniref:uncharacterized protein LOC113313982 isoform X2 n=1 Tax=Papaver somniferum TaxID=3469 RepID=UPI000E6FBCAC|nr:uncharacterized protein LOC113313982 isoform X2 [Papaver somniferum]